MMNTMSAQKKTRLLFVSAAGIEHGGVQNVLLSWVKELPRDKYDISWIAFGYCKSEELKSIYIKNGVACYCGNMSDNQPFFHLRCFLYLMKVMSKGSYDIIHINTGVISVMFLSLLTSKIQCIPFRIAHSHNCRNEKNEKNKFKIIVRKGLRRYINASANKKLACSSCAAQWMFGDDCKDYQVIVNPILDIDKFVFSPLERVAMRKLLGLKESTRVFGVVGALNAQKNVRFAINVFKCLLTTSQDSVLIIVGDGNMRDEISDMINNYHLEDSVMLLGERADIYNIMQAMDCLLFPSIYEGYGLVAVEAQISGMPVYASSNVPRDVDCSDKIFHLNLSAGPAQWANYINQTFSIDNNRVDSSKRTYDVVKNKCDSVSTPLEWYSK